jgi:ppGpp synthetase/RelA/SpoT-type nucleotidyltranferase
MPLPVTKGELNRLGDRLIAAETVSEADLRDLAVVWATYQETLEHVKVELRSLGFSPTGRVKTTKTTTEKLRRTRGMELSRMQDLAGARIVVHDLTAQDEAKDKICEFFVAQGCAVRLVDRREDPRFGYKAVHLIPKVDGMPVEIQVRTELQDTWAQIVERLADRWGRGIRYGEDPENPEVIVRSGELALTRRGAIEILMRLSDAVSTVEQARATFAEAERSLDRLGHMMQRSRKDPQSDATRQRLVNKIPAEMVPLQERLAAILARSPDRLEPADQQLLEAGADITGAQLLRIAEISHVIVSREASERAARLRDSEQELRDILQLIADATDEEA